MVQPELGLAMDVRSSPAVPDTKHRCDVLVVGSGAGGFAAAITARKAGLDVLLTEKALVVDFR